MKFEDTDLYRTRNAHIIEASASDDVWVIGDVHGCAWEFENLCSKIKSANPQSIIIQLGDLIDRGPNFKEVFDVIEKYDVKCTIGNHELNFILEHDGLKRCNSNARKISHSKFNLLSQEEQKKILGIMRSMHNFIVVQYHDVMWTLSHSPIKYFEDILNPLHGYDKNMNGWAYCGRNEPYDCDLFLPDVYTAHGHQHWNYQPIREQINAIAIGRNKNLNVDAGCVYGGELVGVNITDGRLLKVKNDTDYTKEGFRK